MNIPSKKILIFSFIVFLIIGGIFVVTQQKKMTHANHSKATYYCPMHPTYTSDRPGDCPICNMKLVKKEESKEMTSQEKINKQIQDICYLHNCHKMHEGKPCPMMVIAKEGEKVTCPICGTHVATATASETKKEKKILYWTDPMLPGYKSDKPGKSPMGMDLVPVYEEETSSSSLSQTPEGYAQVLLSPQKQQLIGVKTAMVGKKKLTKMIRTVGTIAHDPELYQAQAEYIQAIQALERAKQSNVPEIVEQSQRLAESSRIRLRHMGLSDELINEISTWKEPEHSLLYSDPGEPVWVYAKVYEYELPLIRDGQKLEAEIPSNPGQVFEGTLRAVARMVDQETRTIRIRAQLQDPQGQLKPDMFVNVTIEIDLGEVLAVPEEAVFDTGTKKIVFLDKGQGLFEPREVVLSAKGDNFYELKSGLQEGDIIVTSGNFLIDSESRLKAALEGMGSSGGHQHGQ